MQMQYIKSFILFFLFECLICEKFIFFTHAWWDEGHMLVGAIAKAKLSEHDVQLLEFLLGLWSAEFPGMDKLDTACTWADHIKAEGNSELNAIYDLDFFNQFHYESLINNIQNVNITQADRLKPYNGTGASYALKKFGSTIQFLSKKLNYIEQRSQIPILSWNLAIRYFLHIFGDIHQPLHATEAFFKQFPHGDLGGNKILVTSTTEAKNLHAFWDSAAESLTKDWHNLTHEEIVTLVEKYLELYPEEYFHTDLNPTYTLNDIDSILEKSHETAKNFVYKEFTATMETVSPFQIEDEYRQMARQKSEEQIVLAGYRLSRILTHILRAANSVDIAKYDVQFLRDTHTSIIYNNTSARIAIIGYITVVLTSLTLVSAILIYRKLKF